MEIFLTVTALIIAIYPLVSRDRRLDFKLRFAVWGWVFVLLAFGATFYIEFFDFFVANDLAPTFERDWTGITRERVLYLVWLILIICLTIYMRFRGLSRGQIFRFRDLVLELFWSQSYAEVFSLLDSNLKPLVKIYKKDSLFDRLRAWSKPSIESYLQQKTSSSAWKSLTRKIFNRLKRWVGVLIQKVLPSNESYKEAAQELIQGVFLSPKFSAALVQAKPYFGLKIIDQLSNIYVVHDFVSLYFRELLENRHSLLYVDIKNNQNVGTRNKYEIHSSNRILYYFLSDAEVAKKFAIYGPVGEYVLSHISEFGRDPKTDPYNRGMGDAYPWDENAAWHDPLFVGVRFFDIMVSEAMYQNIDWHMWLYYYRNFAEQIARNYSVEDPTADPNAEWPNRYSFVLYRMFGAMTGWLRALEGVPLNQDNVVLHSTAPNHENGNIPKSAIIAMSQCTKEILLSENIPDRFKNYILDMVFRSYFEINQNSTLKRYAELFRSSLHFGGYRMSGVDSQYLHRIRQSLQHHRMEYLIKFDQDAVDELAAAL